MAILSRLLTATAATICFSAYAHAQAISLRVADTFPIGHYVVEEGLKPFMAEVTRQTNGAITFQHFPASQMGQPKDMLSLAQSGVFDVAHIQPAYISEKFPLASVLEMPGLVKSSCAGTEAYLSIGTGDGILAKSEFAPNGVRLIYVVANAPYQFLSKAPIKTVASFKGMKVRTAGGNQDAAVVKLGAVPVRVSGPEMYESLQRGTTDSVVLPLVSVISYDLQGLVKYSTKTVSFGTTPSMYMVTDAAWAKLSPAQQEALVTAGRNASMRACKFVDEQFTATVKKLEDAGVTVQDLPPDETAKLNAELANVTAEWTKQMAGRGKPGEEIVKALKAAMPQ